MAESRFKFFLEKMRFKFKISILNENTLEEVWHFRASRLSMFLDIFLVLVIVFFLSFYLTIHTSLRKFLPGYSDAEIKPQLIEEALRADSLSEKLTQTNNYVDAVRSLLAGNIQVTEEDTKDDVLAKEHERTFIEKSELEATFCEQYEADEKYNLQGTVDISSEVILFYSPAHGIVVKPFSVTEGHYGVDILVAPNESICAVAEGNIISIQHTTSEGAVVMIQHKKDFISVYQRNALLLKKVGDHVNAGESIAIVVRPNENTEKPHTHFELWREGKPQNPETYINFK